MVACKVSSPAYCLVFGSMKSGISKTIESNEKMELTCHVQCNILEIGDWPNEERAHLQLCEGVGIDTEVTTW